MTIPHTPEQNGVSERMNRTLLESARAMISHAGLSNIYWAEAVSTAAYLRNRTTTSAFKEDTMPYETWYGRKPDISHLKVFGCVAYAHIPDSERGKLDKKAEKLRFVGYCKNSKGYRLFDEETQKVKKRRDVTSNESSFNFSTTATKTVKQLMVDTKSEIEDEPLTDEPSTAESEQQEPHHSERQKRPPNRYRID